MQVVPFRAIVSAAACIAHEVKQGLEGAEGVTTKRTFHMLHGVSEKLGRRALCLYATDVSARRRTCSP
jgi:hypothetical protein